MFGLVKISFTSVSICPVALRGWVFAGLAMFLFPGLLPAQTESTVTEVPAVVDAEVVVETPEAVVAATPEMAPTPELDESLVGEGEIVPATAEEIAASESGEKVDAVVDPEMEKLIGEIGEIPDNFLIDQIPQDLTVNSMGNAKATGPVDDVLRRMELRRLRTRVMGEERTKIARQAVDSATTFQGEREAFRAYYRTIYGRMRQLAPELKDLIAVAEERDLERAADFPLVESKNPKPEKRERFSDSRR